MDTTSFQEEITRLVGLDPAEAPDMADTLAEYLTLALDGQAETETAS